jgi:hypothetical protein
MNKYRNKKVTISGIRFDSQAEARRFQQLWLLEKAGAIKELVLQPKFELQPSYKKNGKNIRAITYKADFAYYENNKFIVGDVKGYETEAFKIKEKLFNYKYKDIELRIVR